MGDIGLLRLEGVYRNGYGIVPKFVMHDPDLTLESKAIYSYLCALAGNGDRTFPYRDTILRHLGLSKNTYYRHYNLLIKEGYISVIRPPDKNAANIYTLISNPKKLEGKKVDRSYSNSTLRYKGLKSHGYGAIPKAVMLDERLSVKAKGLYAYLCSYCGSGDCAFPRRDDIVFHLGVSEPTYYKCYNQLLEFGYLIAVQRKTGTRFGVNDYYLNEYPEMKEDIPPDSPCPKNCDTENSPCPSFRDTKIRDTIFGDIKNCDAISNNNISNNKNTKISPSINFGRIGAFDRKKNDGRTKDEIFEIYMQILHEHSEYFAQAKVNDDETVREFTDYIAGKISGKEIRDMYAYIKKAMVNWMRSRMLYEKFAAPAPVPGGRRLRSYDMEEMERMMDAAVV